MFSEALANTRHLKIYKNWSVALGAIGYVEGITGKEGSKENAGFSYQISSSSFISPCIRTSVY